MSPREEGRDPLGADPPQNDDFAERWISEMVPEDVDWRSLVRAYPLPSLVAAAGFGFAIGRRHGKAIVEALVSFAGYRFGQAFLEVLDREGEG